MTMNDNSEKNVSVFFVFQYRVQATGLESLFSGSRALLSYKKEERPTIVRNNFQEDFRNGEVLEDSIANGLETEGRKQ